MKNHPPLIPTFLPPEPEKVDGFEHIKDIRDLAEEMAMTAEGVPGMNLHLSKARIARICRAFLEATRPEERAIELLLRRATVYVESKHMHIVTTMPEGPPVKHPCAACDLLAEIREALVSPQLLSMDKK